MLNGEESSTQCTFLPELAADSLQTSSLDTHQLSLLSGIDTPAKYSENVQQTDGFLDCKCGKGISDCLIHPSTPGKWTAFMQDSLAKTLALLENRQVYLREPDQVFTVKSCVSLAWLDQNSCSWKTYQQSFLTDSEPYLQTWPRWGMTQGGCAYVHLMSERRITETDGSHWLPTPTAKANQMAPSMQKHRACRNLMFPTPTTVDAGTGRFNTSVSSSNHRPTLAMMAKKNLWPTPTARIHKGGGKQMTRKDGKSRMDMLDWAVEKDGGRLNPTWVEWLMGFPIGFTVSKDWVTRKSHSKQQQHIDSLEEFK